MKPDTETLPLPLEDMAAPAGAVALYEEENPAFWIATDEFSKLAKIAPRNANEALKNCLSGKTWRDHALKVRKLEGVPGHGGTAYQVYVPSLPYGLADEYRAMRPALFRAPATPFQATPEPSNAVMMTQARMQRRRTMAEWRESIIAPVVVHPTFTRERSAVIRGILAKTHLFPNGKSKKIAQRTLYEWIERYEVEGLNGLMNQHRVQNPERVVAVSRKWDAGCPLPQKTKNAIAAEILAHIKESLRGKAPLKKAQGLAEARLVTLCQEAGWAEASLKNCPVGLALVRKFKHFRKVAMKSLDAKHFMDKMKPRIVRNRKGYAPMQIVMGDVHPVDIVKTREDGSDTTARMISWIDIATGRVHSDIVIYEKGKGVTQADVVKSFVAMVRKWGLPCILYLDNGSEYRWKEWEDGLRLLSMMFKGFRAFFIDSDEFSSKVNEAVEEQSAEGEATERQDAIIRARPHNPTGKAMKEGVYGLFERSIFCMIPGWIGGDRMNKTTHKLGAAPRAYGGTAEEFKRDIAQAVEFYHNTEQRGALKGESPYSVYEQFIQDGWQAVQVDYSVLLFAFSERKQYVIQNDGITIENKATGGRSVYWHDRMSAPDAIGEKVWVHYAKWDTSQIFMILPKPGSAREEQKYLCPKSMEYGVIDPAGAVEQGRRESVQNAQFREYGAGIKRPDMVPRMAEFNHHSGPAPVTPFGPRISLEDQGLEEAFQAPKPVAPVIRLRPDQWHDPKTGEVRSALDQLEPETAEEDPKAAELAYLAELGRRDIEEQKENSRQAGTLPGAY